MRIYAFSACCMKVSVITNIIIHFDADYII